MGANQKELEHEAHARRGVAIAFLILAAGSFIDLTPYLSIVGIVFSVIAIGLLLMYRNYFTRKQKRAVYTSIILYVVVTVIVVAGFVVTAFTIIEQLVSAGFSFVIPAQQVQDLFNSLLPLLVLNAAAADGLCYYLLVMRLLHRFDHAIYLGALLVSVALRVLVLLLTHNGSLPLPQQIQGYISLIRVDFYDPYQFALSILASLILGFLLIYVAAQVSRGKVLRM